MKSLIATTLIATCMASPLAMAGSINDMSIELNTAQMDSITAGVSATASASASSAGDTVAVATINTTSKAQKSASVATSVAVSAGDGQLTTTAAATTGNVNPMGTTTVNFNKTTVGPMLQMSIAWSYTVPNVSYYIQ